MLKVLVVDDELPIREMIGNLIKWDKMGFEITHFARNGKEALELYKTHRHDLIITDIIMPGMDGLELIRKVRAISQGQKIIILSCHENFYYAKEAIKFGVQDYILKDMLTPEDFYALLPDIKVQLTNAAELTEQKKTEQREKGYESFLLREFLFGCMKEEEFSKNAEQLDLSGPFVMLGIHIDEYLKYEEDYLNNNQQMLQLRDIMQKQMELLGAGIVVYRDRGEFVILFELDTITSTLKFMADCNNLASYIRTVCMENQYSVTVGISNGFVDIMDLKAHYREVEQAIKCRMFMGKGKIIFYSMRLVRRGFVEAEQFEKRYLSIEKYLSEKETEKLNRAVIDLYQVDLKGFMQFSQIKYINSMLIKLAIRYFERWKISYDAIFEEGYMPIEQLDKLETIDEMCYWFSRIFKELVRVSNEQRVQYSPKVNKAIEYINQNYMKNIGLKEVADELGIHRVYLSNIFNSEVGKTFSQYLLQYRIQKGIEMMAVTELKNYEIAEKTGFANAQQFSVAFKKITGATPTEYRQKEGV